MRLHGKDSEIPQVCLDLGFEYYKEPFARMYNPQLNLTLWVSEPISGERCYVLQDCSNGDIIGNCRTDWELRQLVASARAPNRIAREAPVFCGVI